MSEELSNRELRRFENQIKMPGMGLEGQQKLKNARVVVVGAGGIGTNALMHLTTAGIGTLGIIDNSIVEESNLHRQVLYGSSDLGKQKAIVTKQKLEQINPQTVLNIHNLIISSTNAYDICIDYDIIIDATNSNESFENILSFCVSCSKPMIYSKIQEFEIEIGIITDFQKFKNPENNFQSEKSGFISPVSGIAGALVSIEAIKLLVGLKSEFENNILHFNALNTKLT